MPGAFELDSQLNSQLDSQAQANFTQCSYGFAWYGKNSTVMFFPKGVG
jgi:hypothetical protein